MKYLVDLENGCMRMIYDDVEYLMGIYKKQTKILKKFNIDKKKAVLKVCQKFNVKPDLAGLQFAETGNITVAGDVAIRIKKISSGMNINLIVPNESQAILHVPKVYQKVYINGKISKSKNTTDPFHNLIPLSGGKYKILYTMN